jgi:hypothetical protein
MGVPIFPVPKKPIFMSIPLQFSVPFSLIEGGRPLRSFDERRCDGRGREAA